MTKEKIGEILRGTVGTVAGIMGVLLVLVLSIVLGAIPIALGLWIFAWLIGA